MGKHLEKLTKTNRISKIIKLEMKENILPQNWKNFMETYL